MVASKAVRPGIEVPFVERLKAIRWTLFALLSLITLVGIIMLYSAAGADFSRWSIKHGYRYLASVTLLFAIALIDIRFWLRYAYVGYFAGILGLLFVTFFGVSAK